MSEAVKNLVVNRIVAVADSFDRFLRHHTGSLPFGFHRLQFVKSTLTGSFHRFKLFAKSSLRFEILLLRGIHFFEVCALLFKEAVACRAEAVPDFVGLALGHGAHSLPGFLELL